MERKVITVSTDLHKLDFEGAAQAREKKARTTSPKYLRNPLYADVIIYFILLMLGTITVIPFINIIAYSFSSSNAIAYKPFMLWPHEFTLEAFVYLFNTGALRKAFMISVGVTASGSFLSLFVTILAAYGLSKTYVPGNKIMMRLVLIAMLFGAGLIPTFITINRLGLVNNYAVLVLPFLVSPYNIILMRNFFWSIPQEMEESAVMDGASPPLILFNIVIPLSKAVIATIGLFYAIGHWNDFYRGLFYMTDSTKWPLPMLLRSIIVDNRMTGMGQPGEVQRKVVSPDNIKASTIIFATVPILLVYPFLQKHFTKGIMIGAIKG